MAVFFYALMVMLLLGMAALLLGMRSASSEKQLIRERFGGLSSLPMGDQVKRMALAASHMGPVESLRRKMAQDAEVVVLLAQAGLHSPQARSLYYSASVLTPVVLVALVLLSEALLAEGLESPWLMVLMAAIIGFLLPKRVLGWMAASRRDRIGLELPLFVQTLRILFDSGLAVEQTLRVLSQEAVKVFPNVAHEISRALQRASSGLDLPDELARVAGQLQIDEFTDTVSILRQMIRQGGSARSSLLNLQKLIEDRQLVAMQERVTKLSAKMAIVMILFLFPALFILLAAPGFMALARALGGMS